MQTDTAAAAQQALMGLLEDPQVRADPYSAYDRMRDAGDGWQSNFGFWFVTSYEDADRLMRHPDLVRQYENSWEIRGEMIGAIGRPWFEMQRNFLLFIDPPDHTRIRGLVRRAFTPRFLEKLRPQIVSRVEALVGDIAKNGGGDIVSDLALPLPMMVICDMLGVPAEDRDSFRDWTVKLAATLEPFPSDEVQKDADRSAEDFQNYFRELIKNRRNEKREDLLSRLIEVEEEGEKLTEQELILTGILLLAAGFETTTNLIGNGTLALLSHRDQWDLLVNDPSLAPQAVEELLRYDSPVQLATPRVARKPIENGWGVIQETEIMIPVVGGANRDPRRFEDPHSLNITRPDTVPLSFGGGPHFCLGASLARIEGAEVFSHLPKTIPSLKLDEPDPAWRPTLNIRGLDRLRVTA